MEKYLSVGKYNKWLDRIYNDCPIHKDIACTAYTLGYCKRDNYIVIWNNKNATLRIVNLKTGKTGWSKLNKKDRFNSKIALAIAWARYCKYDIPKQYDFITIDSFTTMKSGTSILDTYFNDEYIFVGMNPVFHNQVVVMPSKTETQTFMSSKTGTQTFMSLEWQADRFVLGG